MKRAWLRFGMLCVLAAGVLLTLYAFDIDLGHITPERVRQFVLSFGVLAPLAYLVVYSQPIIPLPASVITITGGLAFGPLWGALAAITGATLRAYGQFWIARSFGREAIETMCKSRLARLNRFAAQNGFHAILFIRLIPNFPYDIQNFVLGCSPVQWKDYAAGTFVGILPAQFAFAYLGYSLTDPRHIWKLLLALLVIVTVVFLPKLWQRRHPDQAPLPLS